MTEQGSALIFAGRRCDNCGSPDRSINDRGECPECEMWMIERDETQLDTALTLLRAVITAALDGPMDRTGGLVQRVHVDDLVELVKECVTAHYESSPGSGPRSRRELAEASSRSLRRRDAASLVDAEIDDLERRLDGADG